MRIFPLVALLIGPVVVAAPAPPAQGRSELSALQAEVAELKRTLAEVPAALDELHALANRVEALRAAVDRAGGAKVADGDLRGQVDALAAELGETRRRLQAVEARRSELPVEGAGIAYDRGVVIRGGSARVTVNGLLQARMTGEYVPGLVGVDSFDLHHAQVSVVGEVGEWASARLTVDFGNGYFPGAPFAVRGGLLRDALIEVRPLSWLTLRGGQYTVPFGRQRAMRDGLLASAGRSLATLAFTLDRDIGVLVQARPFGGRLLVEGSVTDGINAGASGGRNDNLDLRYVVHAAFSPFGEVPLMEGNPEGNGRARVTVGGAAMYDLSPTNDPANRDRDGNGRVDNVQVLSVAAEVAASWGPLSGQAEYFWRREDAGGLSPLGVRQYQGFYTQAQILIIEQYFMVEAHASYAEAHTLATGLAVGSGPPSPFQPDPGANASVFDILVSQRGMWNVGGSAIGLYRSHDLKLSATYDWHQRVINVNLPNAPDGKIDAHVLQVQATVGF